MPTPPATEHDAPLARSPAFPVARLDLEEEIRQMRASPRSGDHVSKTVLHHPDLRIVLIVLDRGARIPEHRAEGTLTVQTLDGRVAISLLGSSFELARGQLLAIAREVPHDVAALEDSAILLSVGWDQ